MRATAAVIARSGPATRGREKSVRHLHAAAVELESCATAGAVDTLDRLPQALTILIAKQIFRLFDCPQSDDMYKNRARKITTLPARAAVIAGVVLNDDIPEHKARYWTLPLRPEENGPKTD